MIQRLDFKRAGDQADRANAKRYENKKKNTLVITKVPTSREDWTMKTQAGCKFWVHNRTGEATTTCPFDCDADLFPTPQTRAMTPIHRSLFTVSSTSPAKSEPTSSSPQSSSPQQLPSDELGILLESEDATGFSLSNADETTMSDAGTGLGALIYDNSEYQDLMRALDTSLSLSPCRSATNSKWSSR